ncbi:MAG TPA: hypothetical protein VMS56_12025, partial [Thermoanaerobaculia bacterium]|nr:hypothetical protein [Thermoanaerobaculia bacterium]
MNQLILIHSESFPIDELHDFLQARRIEPVEAHRTDPGDGPAIVILDETLPEVPPTVPRPSLTIRIGVAQPSPTLGAEIFASFPTG